MLNLQQGDCLELMKTLKDNSVDLIFTDPPYALGSEVIIRADGKVDYKKAVDFMNKWDMPTGEFWEEWYKEAFRVLKYGGHCLMFGLDRQLLLFKYYGALAGFTEKQSLYWYFISNFPKATDLSKNIDKYFGVRENENRGFSVVGDDGRKGGLDAVQLSKRKDYGYQSPPVISDLAKKYNGYKYSIAPTKQTNETIMVFQKPYKTKSCLHDVLAYENGDESITVGAIDIAGNRVMASDVQEERLRHGGGIVGNGTSYELTDSKNIIQPGRFPAQTYIDSGASEVIDKQSGVLKSGGGNTKRKNEGATFDFGQGYESNGIKDSGGASRILHKCDYEKGEYDIYQYCAKVSKKERNSGLDNRVSIYYDFNICQNEQNLTQEVVSLQLSEDMDKLHQKDIEEFGQQKKKDMLWNIDMFGKKLMAKFLMDCISTTKTTTNSTIDLTTWNWLTPLFTNGYIQGVNLETMDGINLVLSVNSSYTSQIITEIKKQGGFNPSVNLAELSKPLLIKGKLKLENLTNFHCTVKPKKLLSNILKLFKTPNKQVLLDPFMGSGSMGISAVETGFNYIGYELDKDYFKIAEARIQNAINKQEEKLL